MMQRTIGKVILLLAWGLLAAAPSGQAQRAEQTLHDFGALELDAPLEHTFTFRNESVAPLRISNVQLTPPLIVTKMPSLVEPGATAAITVRMEKPRMRGEYRGSIAVNFKNEGVAPLVFWTVGQLVAAIEFDPFAAFYLTAQRGEARTQSIEIANHETAPMEILNVLHGSTRFATAVDTIEAGRRFRLTLRMKPDAPPGRATDEITVVTSSRAHPLLRVQANTVVNERVYAFPSELDFETIHVMGLKAQMQPAAALRQSMTIYQSGGTDFRVLSVQSDLPFLRATARQGILKDRVDIEVQVIPEKLKQGEVSGTITATTSDPDFPTLAIPVKAAVDDNW